MSGVSCLTSLRSSATSTHTVNEIRTMFLNDTTPKAQLAMNEIGDIVYLLYLSNKFVHRKRNRAVISEVGIMATIEAVKVSSLPLKQYHQDIDKYDHTLSI